MSKVTLTETVSKSSKKKNKNAKTKSQHKSPATETVCVSTRSTHSPNLNIQKRIIEDIPRMQKMDSIEKTMNTKFPVPKSNKYVSAILLPYKSKLCKVPSDFAGASHVHKANINVNVPVLGSGITSPNSYNYMGNNNFPPGLLMVKMCRSYANPVQVLQESFLSVTTASTSYNRTTMVRQQGANEGIFSQTGVPTVGVGETMQFSPGQVANLVGPFNTETGITLDMPVFPFKNNDKNGNIFFMHSLNFQPTNSSTNTGTINVTIKTNNGGAAVNAGINISVVDASGAIMTNAANLGAGAGIVTTSFPSGQIAGAANGGDFRGDRGIGIQVSLATTVQNDIEVENFCISYSYAPNIYTDLQWKALNFDDINSALPVFSGYRAVGQSMWVKWIGGKGFNANGGTISSATYSGGNNVLYANSGNGFLWTQNGLRASDTAYVGAVDNGTYGFTYPNDYKSQDFLSMGSHQPYVGVQAIVTANVNQSLSSATYPFPPNLLMLKVCIIYETLTQKSWINTSPSNTVIREAEVAAKILNKLIGENGSFMSNDTHEDIVKYAMLPAQVINGYAKELTPLVNQILPLLAMGSLF